MDGPSLPEGSEETEEAGAALLDEAGTAVEGDDVVEEELLEQAARELRPSVRQVLTRFFFDCSFLIPPYDKSFLGIHGLLRCDCFLCLKHET